MILKHEKRKLLILPIIVLIAIIGTYYFFKTEKVYILKELDSQGRILGTNEYVIRNGDTIMHGKFINYNESGIKLSEGRFVDNEPSGICTYYNDNGKIESAHYRRNSEVTLESIYYNPKGYVEKYVVYDDLGKSSFIIHFDNKGVTKYTGYPVLEIYQYKYANKEKFNIKKDQLLKLGDTLKYKYIVANIPNAKRSFAIENLGIDNSKVQRILKKVPPAQIDVEEVLIKKGRNTIRSVVRYEFDDKVTPVFTDTLTFDVDVR